MSYWFRKQVPVVLQGEENECGLSCMAMVLGYHDHHVSLSSLRSYVGHNRQLTLKELTVLAYEFDLLPRSLRCEPSDFGELSLPAILHLDMNHFVVLECVTGHGIWIADPVTGRTELSWESVNRRFTGIALELKPGPRFQVSGHERRFSVLPLFMGIPLREFRSGLVALLALSLLVQIFALITPFFLQIVVDEVLMVSNLELAEVVIAGFLLIYMVSGVSQFLRGLLVLKISTRLSFMLSAGLITRVMNISLPYFQSREVGDIASRFASLEPIRQFVSESLVRIVIDGLMLLTTFAVLLSIAPEVAWILLAGSFAYVLVQYFLLQPYRRHQHEFIVSDAKLQTHFIESIQSIGTLKRNQATQQRADHWLNNYADSLNASIKATHWALSSDIARYLLVGWLGVAVVAMAVPEVIGGELSLGILYTLSAYSLHFTSALVSLTAEWQSYLMLSLHAQRVADLTDADQEPNPPELHMISEPVRTISFRNLSYRYDERSKPLFRLNTQIRMNESLALTGSSGSGKSTLLALIRGEVKAASGDVLVNDIALGARTSRTTMISSLLPGDSLIRGSVIDNISYLDPIPDHKRIIRVAKITGIHKFILGLPMGYQQPLCEEHCHFSSGQRQRLLIARTLYRRADVLLLDEATSHLDEAAELKLMSRILALPKICIFVTHREKVARLANQVVCLSFVKGNTNASQTRAIAKPIAR